MACDFLELLKSDNEAGITEAITKLRPHPATSLPVISCDGKERHETGQQPTPAPLEDSYGVAPTSSENVNNGTLTQEISSPATYPASLAILQEMAISLQKQGSQGKTP
jgi:hypothetical protein